MNKDLFWYTPQQLTALLTSCMNRNLSAYVELQAAFFALSRIVEKAAAHKKSLVGEMAHSPSTGKAWKETSENLRNSVFETAKVLGATLAALGENTPENAARIFRAIVACGVLAE